VTLALREAGQSQPVHLHDIPKRFLAHASRGQVLEELGLTADALVADLQAHLS
jgi:1-deoxy-D-xylulose-5-phosphate synthase